MNFKYQFKIFQNAMANKNAMAHDKKFLFILIIKFIYDHMYMCSYEVG